MIPAYSGRVELWLETKYPDQESRRLLFERKASELPSELKSVSTEHLVRLTEGFSGADVVSAMQDAVGLLAWDEAQQLPLRTADAYFERACQDVQTRRQAVQGAGE